MSCHTLAQSICKWKAGVSYGILPYFFGGTYQPRQAWPDDPQFFFSRWWSTELVTWTGRATCCRTDRASACSARTAIYKLQVAKFASPWQVLLSSSLRQYHSDSSTFKLHGARYEVQTGSRHTFWIWGSTRKEGKTKRLRKELGRQLHRYFSLAVGGVSIWSLNVSGQRPVSNAGLVARSLSGYV